MNATQKACRAAFLKAKRAAHLNLKGKARRTKIKEARLRFRACRKSAKKQPGYSPAAEVEAEKLDAAAEETTMPDDAAPLIPTEPPSPSGPSAGGLPTWALPAGAAAVALILLVAMRGK